MKACQTQAAPATLLLSAYLKKPAPKKKETAGASTGAAQTRAGTRESRKKVGGAFKFIGTFQESEGALNGSGRRFRVTLIEEGLGNFGKCYFYTKQALQTAVPLYEGAHFFVDHPSKTEEEDRPERSVNDLSGYFENCALEQNDLQQAIVTADLVLMSGTACDNIKAKIQESLQFKLKHPDKDLVGLSINASGDFEEAPIDLFIQDAGIPEACKEKLIEAKGRGINTIRPVLEINTAVSCDLVTAAGAGGKINQLLEGRGKMSTKVNGKTREGKKEAGEPGAEGGAGGAGASQTADSQGGHADADQDKELIMDMLQKYCGTGFTDDDQAAMKQMYQSALEACGGDEKEAMETAGRSMKLAKHMQSKQPPAEGGQGGDKPAPGSEQPGAQTEGQDDKGETAHSPNPVAGSKVPPGAQHQEGTFPLKQTESARGGKENYLKEIASLNGKVAFLEKRLEERDLKDHIEAKLTESKLPRSATKKFRESILPAVKTVKEFDTQLKVFQEAYSLGGEAGSGFVLGAEKGAGAEAGEGSGFGDCTE